MASSTNRKADRHKDSTMLGVRVTYDLKRDFEAKLELDGKTKNAFLLQCIEEYTYGKQRNC